MIHRVQNQVGLGATGRHRPLFPHPCIRWSVPLPCLVLHCQGTQERMKNVHLCPPWCLPFLGWLLQSLPSAGPEGCSLARRLSGLPG